MKKELACIGLTDIISSHNKHHMGVERTLYILKEEGVEATKKDVQMAVKQCNICNSIDPAPITWPHGDLSSDKTWYRIFIDVTHYNSTLYLSIIDSGPSRFVIWKEIKNEVASSIIKRLTEVFVEHGPPIEILLDNSPTFRSQDFLEFCDAWCIKLEYRCVNRPEGCGTVERCHRTIKRAAARTNNDPLLMVFYYNITPRVMVK